MSGDMDRARMMKRLAIFDSLATREVALLSMVVKDEYYDIGDIIYREGESGDCCYFIVSGEIDVLKRVDAIGGPQVITQLREHQVFGQIALVDDGPRTSTCMACSPTHVLRLSQSDFQALFHAGSGFAFKFQLLIASVAARQLRQANAHLQHVAANLPGARDELHQVAGILAQTDTDSGAFQIPPVTDMIRAAQDEEAVRKSGSSDSV